jgi:hypothetical protein
MFSTSRGYYLVLANKYTLTTVGENNETEEKLDFYLFYSWVCWLLTREFQLNLKKGVAGKKRVMSPRGQLITIYLFLERNLNSQQEKIHRLGL